MRDCSERTAAELRLLSRSRERLELTEVLDLYKSVGRRNIEYFAWIHDVYSWITLPSVSFDQRKVLGEDKTKLAIFDILADDLADNYTTRSFAMLEQLTKIPWQAEDTSVETNDYLQVARKVWEDLISSVSLYPRFGEFERIFYFDLRQVLSSMLYSYLANTEGIENPVETNFYSSYGCVVELAMDMDLMCSPAFDMKELGPMRTVASLAQKIAHIANLLTTYPSELVERDVSSPIISLIAGTLLPASHTSSRSNMFSNVDMIFWSWALEFIEKIAVILSEIISSRACRTSEYVLSGPSVNARCEMLSKIIVKSEPV